MPVCKLSQSVFGAALLAWAVVATASPAGAQPMAPRPPAPPASGTPSRPASPPPAAPPRAPAPPGAPASTAARPPTPPPSPDRGSADPSQDPVYAGTATLLRNGQPVALGVVLASDGRVVTSRAVLAGGRKNLTLRFVDGSTVAATVGHEDAAKDLALLVPARLVWTRGLVPASAIPAEGSPLSMVELKQNRLDRRATRAKGSLAAPAADLEVTPPFLPGAPVVDGSGRAVGVVVQSCEGGTAAAPCKPRPRLATVAALRDFLRGLPATAALPAAYLGVRGERAIGNFARGVRVVEVSPGSPAALAKVQPGADGDLVLAVGGQPVTTPDELTRALGRHAPGDKVALTLFTRGTYRQIEVVLGRAPAGGAGGEPASAPAPARPPQGPPASPPRSPTDGAPRDFGTRR